MRKLRRDWVVVGAIELIAGIGVIVLFLAVLSDQGDWTTIPASVGGLLAFIGTIVLVYGLLAKDARHVKPHRDGNCLYCGRPVEAGTMICSHCAGRRGDGKSP